MGKYHLDRKLSNKIAVCCACHESQIPSQKSFYAINSQSLTQFPKSK